ncbi:M23 family metallopeptidase [Fictibacillus fluitans]|uniref:M23 family metallopeptidase n=1 Tax=Fictibacillus fluitans TaxID=3058422 RepID=A0ABT8HZ26_9BACL|nr:M23 family metallopeptidase [Fictibacillus sp. NE201]MDN4525996.1 M23 family metallopeptidase [Fictibacillus sp. NE201]
MIWYMAVVYYVLPIVIMFELIRGKFPSKRAWLFEVVGVGFIIAYLFLTGRWDIVSYYFRIIWPLVFVFVAVRSYVRSRDLPAKGPAKNFTYLFGMGVRVILIGFFGYVTAMALTGYSKGDSELALSFPLKNGTFYTAHGGAATNINYHHPYRPQAYALDIVQLNGLGIRSNGWNPDNLKSYEIYGTAIFSPCDGTVMKTKDGLKEIPPSKMDDSTKSYREKYPEGNHVVLKCKDTDVLMAHMIPQSVQVEKGQEVASGDQLGKVGNSGNTSEPHLHIHAERDGNGVPITFNGRFAKRNSLFFE